MAEFEDFRPSDEPPSVTAEAVLEAYRKAREAGLPSPACYMAGVEVWRERHPDHKPSYAAKQAVAVILQKFAPTLLRIDE